MVEILSFDLEGDFGAFRDPSVTTNQTSYLIPSKTTLIGLLAGILGIDRPNTCGALYSTEYLAFFKATKIGLKVRNDSKKTVFYTNHRSFKEAKTKPFKTELVTDPKFTVYVLTSQQHQKHLFEALRTASPKYTPHLGHAYCLARIFPERVRILKGNENKADGKKLSCVVLDEGFETENKNGLSDVESEPGKKVVIERHLHRYFDGEEFSARVLRHWIPINSYIKPDKVESPMGLSSFFEISPEKELICLF